VSRTKPDIAALKSARSAAILAFRAVRTVVLALAAGSLLGACEHFGLTDTAAEESGPTLPEETSLPGLDYTVEITGVPEDSIASLLRQSSQLVALKDRPPPSLAGLQRRAEGDRERLGAALRSEGFYGATIQTRIDRNATPVQVTIDITTGDQYLLAEYEIGYREAPAPERQPALEELGLHIGMRARAPDIITAEKTLVEQLGRNGHPQAQVLDRKTLVDHDAKIMTVKLSVDAGPAARFGSVALNGLESVKEDYPRGLIAWRDGESFDTGKLEATRQALAKTGLFASVKVEADKQIGPDGNLPVAITVKEAPHRSIGFGASYSTSEGLGGEVFWEHRNILGRNEQLRLGLTAAEIEQALAARFRKPAFLRRDQDLLIESSLTNRNTEAFDEQSFLGAAALERELSEHWRASAGVTGEYSIIEDEDGEHTFQLIGFPVLGKYDSSDNLLNPTEGARLTASITPYSGQGDSPLFFGVGALIGSTYYAIDSDRRFVLAGRAKVGTIFGEQTDDVPANKRFYAGGGGSIRGYEFQSVGPLDAENDPLGGRSVIEVSGELRVRITEEIGVVPFVDGGSAFDPEYPDFEETMRWAGGMGLRYFSPVGPVRLDVAVPINKREIDDAFQFYISLGQAF
jgi:translocation and assembly module TamA